MKPDLGQFRSPQGWVVPGVGIPAVVIPILIQNYILLQRDLLYTGVTRGKKLVVLVEKGLGHSIRNNKTEKRYTLLRERLMGMKIEIDGQGSAGYGSRANKKLGADRRAGFFLVYSSQVFFIF